MTTTNANQIQKGFTLVEMMMVLAVLSIILAIAIPSYRQHVQKTNRTEATTGLLAIAAAQEKFYVKNNTYTDSDTDFELGTLRHYSFAVELLDDGSGFRATAEPNVDDPDCESISIDHTGRKTYVGTIPDSVGCW